MRLKMTPTDRQKLIAERNDLEKLRKLYKKHAVQAIGAIRKCDRRIIRINYLLTKEP